MSDSEPATTEIPAKPRKERTEAQKRATAKALEALALHREAKRAEKEKATVVKRTTTTTKVMPKPKAKAPEPVEEEEYEPPPRVPSIPRQAKPLPPPIVNTYDITDDIKAIRQYVEAKKVRKSKKEPPTIDLHPVFDSSSESEEEVVVKKKKKPSKAPPPTPEHHLNNGDPQAMLQSIFWRNM